MKEACHDLALLQFERCVSTMGNLIRLACSSVALLD